MTRVKAMPTVTAVSPIGTQPSLYIDVFTFSSSGFSMRHGPHHTAKTSSIRGKSHSVISFSSSSAVTCRTPANAVGGLSLDGGALFDIIRAVVATPPRWSVYFAGPGTNTKAAQGANVATIRASNIDCMITGAISMTEVLKLVNLR